MEELNVLSSCCVPVKKGSGKIAKLSSKNGEGRLVCGPPPVKPFLIRGYLSNSFPFSLVNLVWQVIRWKQVIWRKFDRSGRVHVIYVHVSQSEQMSGLQKELVYVRDLHYRSLVWWFLRLGGLLLWHNYCLTTCLELFSTSWGSKSTSLVFIMQFPWKQKHKQVLSSNSHNSPFV